MDALAESGALLTSLEHTIAELRDFITELRAEVHPDDTGGPHA